MEDIDGMRLSCIPLSITLESHEVAAFQLPPPLLLLPSRVLYLPQLMETIFTNFKSYLQPSYGVKAQPWLDSGGTPLDWRLPIGVLFDILFGVGMQVQLPWHLTLHVYTPLPEGDSLFSLNPYKGWGDFEMTMLNKLKFSSFIYNKSPLRFQQMKKADELQMLNAFRSGHVEAFYRVSKLFQWDLVENISSVPIEIHFYGPPYRRLFTSSEIFANSNPSESMGTPNGETEVQHASFDENTGSVAYEEPEQLDIAQDSAYPPVSSDLQQQPDNAAHKESVQQITVRNDNPENSKPVSCLGDFLHQTLPQLFPIVTDVSATPRDAYNAATFDQIDGIWLKRADPIILGISVPLKTPLLWLVTNACQFDHCLHIVLRLSPELVGDAKTAYVA